MANGLTTFSQAPGAPLKKAVPEAEQSDSPKSDLETAAPEATESDKKDARKTEPEGHDARKMEPGPPHPEKSESAESSSTPPVVTREEDADISPTLSRQSLPWTEEPLELDHQLELEKTKSKPISLSNSADGTILVDWYSTDDPDNPQNWSQGKKMCVLVQIW